MKDRELRRKLDEIGIIKIDHFNEKIKNKDEEFYKYKELEHKVDLLLNHFGLEYKTGARLEKSAK